MPQSYWCEGRRTIPQMKMVGYEKICMWNSAAHVQEDEVKKIGLNLPDVTAKGLAKLKEA